MNFKEYLRSNTFLAVQFVFFSLLTLALFYSSLHDFFLADDFWYLLKISKRSWIYVVTQFYSHFDPLPVLLNKIIYSFWTFFPVPYRLLLFLVHSLFCLVVYMVAVKLFTIFGEEAGKDRIYIKSLICALLFSVMYIHTENVLYINGHHEAFFSLFFITALYFYLGFKLNGSSKDKILLYVFYILALLSKENSIVFILLIFCIEFLFFRTKILLFIKNLWVLIFISFGYTVLRIFLYEEHKLGITYSTDILVIIIESIKNIFFTFTAFIFSLDFILIKNIFRENDSNFVSALPALFREYPVAAICIVTSGLIYLLIFIKRNKIINFGFLYIIITIAPFMWLVGYERYLYLPSFGFALLASESLVNLYYKKSAFYRYSAMILISCFLVYNIYNTFVKKENYSVASQIAFNGVNEIMRVSVNLPAGSNVYFRNLPDNYNGAWIFRDGVQYMPELFLNRNDLKFYKIYEEDINTNEEQNIYVFNYDSGNLKLEK